MSSGLPATSTIEPLLCRTADVLERTLVRFAIRASVEYDQFIFRDAAASEQFNAELYRRGGSCYGPPLGRLVFVNGVPAGMFAVVPPDALRAGRVLWAAALPRARMRSDPGLRLRFRLATSVLVRPLDSDAYLSRISVAPEFAGQGIAKRMLDEALAETRRAGLRRCVLEVAATNERALALYRSAGFGCIGEASATDPDSGATLSFVHLGKEV
jgi:GNAT superfamily N-acetyltransferase